MSDSPIPKVRESLEPALLALTLPEVALAARTKMLRPFPGCRELSDVNVGHDARIALHCAKGKANWFGNGGKWIYGGSN